MRSGRPLDGGEGLVQVLGDGVGRGDGVLAGPDLDGAVAPGGLDEFSDAPAGLLLDPAGHGQRGEHDAQVRVDGLAFVVVDGPGL